MALKPSFVSGASARVKIGSTTLAYATDLSINVTMDTIPIESFGKYEVHANEPNLYAVDGSFRIIRYSARAASATQGNVKDAAATGNDPLYLAASATAGSVKAHLEPGRILGSTAFDLELVDNRQATDIAGVPAAGDIASQTVYKLSNCRVVSRTGTLDRRGVLVETFNFVGLLHQDTDADIDNAGGPDSANTTDGT